ncbi:MAG: hypothetical protein IKL20_00490 [Alistipes sp.]|nr:hypothetical protein [Alistipes sp.]
MEKEQKFGKLLVDNGAIIKPAYKWWGLFRDKENDVSIAINDIDYIDKVELSSLFGAKWGVAVIAGQHKNIYQPKLSAANADRLVNLLLENGATQGEREYNYAAKSSGLFSKECVTLCEEYGRMTKKTFTQEEYRAESVDLSKVIFVDKVKSKGKQGLIFGSVAGGGSANTIEIFGFSKELNDKVYKMIIDQNPQLEAKPIKSFESNFPLFNPSRWFKSRESISIADIGLIHKQYGVKIEGKKYSVRTSIVPFHTIKSYWAEGFISKRIDILGSTSIKSAENYGPWDTKEIWNELKRRNIINEYGERFRARLFSRRGQGVFYVNKDGVTFKKKKELLMLPFYSIYSATFEKPWYKLFGTATVKGRRVDARAGEGGDIEMVVEKMWRKSGKRLMAMIESGRATAKRPDFDYPQHQTTTPNKSADVKEPTPKVEAKSDAEPKKSNPFATELKSKIGGEMRSKLGGEMKSEIDNTLKSEIGDEMKSEVKGIFGKTLGGVLGGALGDKSSGLKDLGSKFKK